jgi:anti-sigma factor RsiW
MPDREHLELIASRFFDGDLSPSEKSELDAALAHDAELRALHADLERVHNSISLLAEQRLPTGFRDRILKALDEEEGKLIKLPTAGFRHWAAAAAVVTIVGLLFAAAAFNNMSQNTGPIAYTPPAPKDGAVRPGAAPFTAPSASVIAFSDGEFELTSQAGSERTHHYEGNVSLPAEITAPAETHAVIEVKGGTAVLSPGARARLTDADADGIPDLEPIDGDLYLESAGASVSAWTASVSALTAGSHCAARQTATRLSPATAACR